jgi:hypothetical protein
VCAASLGVLTFTAVAAGRATTTAPGGSASVSIVITDRNVVGGGSSAVRGTWIIFHVLNRRGGDRDHDDERASCPTRPDVVDEKRPTSSRAARAESRRGIGGPPERRRPPRQSWPERRRVTLSEKSSRRSARRLDLRPARKRMHEATMGAQGRAD